MNDKRDWNSLPNATLLHILSLIDTKQAVQSTLISKRWLNLWTLLPNLNFNVHDFENTSSFENFVDKVSTLRDESALIKTFKFNQPFFVKTPLLKRVLSYAISHGVQHLAIFTPFLEAGDPDFSWFSSTTTLLTLKLCIKSIIFPFPQIINACFHNLVSLDLNLAILESSDPLSGCPNIENLTIIDCRIDHSVLVLSGSRLLKLTMKFTPARDFTSRCGELVILSSRLTFIKIKGLQPLCISFPNRDCLPQFNEIYFDSSDTQALTNEGKKKLHSYLTKMLRSLQNAKYVTISATTTEILAYDRDMLAQEQFPFCNLKSLTLVSSNYRLRKTLKIPLFVKDYFIQSSPQAEVNIEYPDSSSNLLILDH